MTALLSSSRLHRAVASNVCITQRSFNGLFDFENRSTLCPPRLSPLVPSRYTTGAHPPPNALCPSLLCLFPCEGHPSCASLLLPRALSVPLPLPLSLPPDPRPLTALPIRASLSLSPLTRSRSGMRRLGAECLPVRLGGDDDTDYIASMAEGAAASR
eukprot:3870346-Rhodomonas_salina.1